MPVPRRPDNPGKGHAGPLTKNRARLAIGRPPPYLSLDPIPVTSPGGKRASEVRDGDEAPGRKTVPPAMLHRRRVGRCRSSRGTIAVNNPATGETLGTVPQHGRRGDPPRDRGGRRARWPAWRAKTAKERAPILRKWFDLMMANQDDLARSDDRRAGQAAGRGARARSPTPPSFIEWFAEEGKRIYGDTIPAHARRQAHRRDQEPIGVVRRDHAVELPGRDDHPQGRAGAGRRLHDGAQAGDRRRRSRRWRWASWPSAPACRKGVFNVVTGAVERDRRRADLEPDRAQADLHRLDRGRQAADGAVRRRRSRRSRWSSAATRRSSSSTTPTSTPRSKGAIASKYRNTGQTCVCANRILVQDGVYDAFAEQARRGGRAR